MPGSPEAPAVSFHAQPDDGFVEYALGLIEAVCGVTVRRVGANRLEHGVDIYYGDDQALPCRLRIPRVERYRIRDVPGVPAQAPAAIAGPFPFDVFAALRFWLADEGNAGAPPGAFDRHDRLLAQYSAQETAGVREIPIVNTYLLSLREWLEHRLRVRARRRLPAGKRCAVVLSHDVDRPLDPTDLRPALEPARAGWRAAPVRASLAGALAVAQVARNRARSAATRRWLFDEVAAAEERRGFRATYFFASTSRFAPGSSWFDVGYDVRSAHLRRAFDELRRHGALIGLHVGYRAHEAAPAAIAAERERLERVAQSPITGSRHHYWHMGRPFWRTLEAHGDAGLRYDSSIGFDEAPGYRLGVALPLRLWDPERGRPLSVVQVPTMAMDGNFFYRPGRTLDGVLAHLERLVDGLKRSEGVAAIDWHQEMSFPAPGPFRHWGAAYVELLDLLAADPQVAVMPYEEVLDGAAPGPSSGADSPSG